MARPIPLIPVTEISPEDAHFWKASRALPSSNERYLIDISPGNTDQKPDPVELSHQELMAHLHSQRTFPKIQTLFIQGYFIFLYQQPAVLFSI
jgi:hypothetical protein